MSKQSRHKSRQINTNLLQTYNKGINKHFLKQVENLSRVVLLCLRYAWLRRCLPPCSGVFRVVARFSSLS